jgi:alpha-1,3-mannosyl-glycoprotein beta-1,2-N-acetylglucosaminyltransferase
MHFFQDCGHEATAEVIKGYGDSITLIEQPDQSEIDVPKKEKKFKGYFKIARHYGWALNQTFNVMNYEQVVIVEDDLEVAPDFYDYFEATLPILRSDPTLWCVSAWNDNGKGGQIDGSNQDLLYRTDFFGGLGWMLTRELWNSELSVKWPKSYWDDWMRQPVQRKGRACIRPEISRTKTFGKVGVSNGLFFDKHLKFIELNAMPVKFMEQDLTYLSKVNYDKAMDEMLLKKSPVASLMDVKNGLVKNNSSVRVVYHTKEVFKKIARALGIMDDFKSGVPRMAYRGTVSTMYKGQRVFVSPNVNWKGYDPSW